MVLENIKNSEKIANTIENMAYYALLGAGICGGFLLLEKVIGFGFDISVHLGL